MAVTLESVQTGAYADGTLTITKPVSLAVGDLMVAVVHGNTTGGITIPSGWTGLTSVAVGAAVTDLITYYKIATSTEVSASNFSWTVAGGQYIGGAIMRITGHHSSNPVAVFATDTEVTTATPTFTSTVTPNTANSIILFFLGTYLNSATTRTASTYAIVTSNPTWTEQLDITTSAMGGATYQTSFASATRPQTTATGNATVTLSGSCTNLGNIMVVVRPQITSTLTETETAVETLTKTPTKNITNTESVVETLIAEKDRIWINQDKNSSSFTNQDKS